MSERTDGLCDGRPELAPADFFDPVIEAYKKLTRTPSAVLAPAISTLARDTISGGTRRTQGKQRRRSPERSEHRERQSGWRKHFDRARRAGSEGDGV